MLTASHLRKEFTNVVAVDDVSFSVRRGQVFGLIGPNGAGKSTTIRMIMDIIEPDRGTITIDGAPPGRAAKNLTGYLPEERGLYRKNKLIDVITYFAALKGLDAQSARRAAMPWLERFSLAGSLKRNVEELSKGNQQKVQFLIAVLHAPKLIVLDEVFSGLDPVNQVIIREALQELRADNRAVVFSTHQMEYAEKLCDDLILINKGRIVLEGSPTEIKQRFGKNSVQMDFDGDGEFLHEQPGVARATVSRNYAEIVLADGADTNALLSAAVQRLVISRFERIEPSLDQIFIDTVGMPAAEPPVQEQPAAPARMISKDPRVRKALFSVLLMAMLFVIFGVMMIRRGVSDPVFFLLYGAGLVYVLFRYVRVRRKVRDEMTAKGNGGPHA